MKTCSTCKVPKDPDRFHKNRALPGGLSNICKVCKNTGKWSSRKAIRDQREKKIKEPVRLRRSYRPLFDEFIQQAF